MPKPSQTTPASAGMQVGSIHSYLIYPGKNVVSPHEISGTTVPMTGVLFEMLRKVFNSAEAECRHNIAFTADANGAQQNDCLDLFVDYIKNCDLPRGREVAKRLQGYTTNKSSLGLMFLMKGQHKGETKLVVSRFPADSGILAEEKAQSLSVAFIERVFMKSSTSYKAAVYSGKSFPKDFWKGRAIDKQINNAESYISDYWIRDFLHSDFLTPGEAGTRRFAIAVREAMNLSSDPKIKMDIAALLHLMAGTPKKIINPKALLDQLQIPAQTKEEIKKRFPKAKAFEENFQFVPAEFVKHVLLRTVELDNGGLLTAPSQKFDDVFASESVSPNTDVVRFTTEGKIVNQRFRKAKP